MPHVCNRIRTFKSRFDSTVRNTISTIKGPLANSNYQIPMCHSVKRHLRIGRCLMDGIMCK